MIIIKAIAQFRLSFLCLSKTIMRSVFKRGRKIDAGFWPVRIRFIFKSIFAVLAVFVHITQIASTDLDLMKHE